MKKSLIIPAIAFATASLSYTPVVQANDVAQTICEYVSSDDKKRLRSFLKSNKMKIRNIFDSIQCNGQNMLEFAATRNSMATGELIIKKLPKSQLTNLLASIENTAELVTVAQNRINS